MLPWGSPVHRNHVRTVGPRRKPPPRNAGLQLSRRGCESLGNWRQRSDREATSSLISFLLTPRRYRLPCGTSRPPCSNSVAGRLLGRTSLRFFQARWALSLPPLSSCAEPLPPPVDFLNSLLIRTMHRPIGR